MTVSPGFSSMFCSRFLPLEHVLVVEQIASSACRSRSARCRCSSLSAYSAQAARHARSAAAPWSAPISGYGPGLATWPVMNTLRLLISLTITVTFGSSTYLAAPATDRVAQLLGRQPGRLDVVEQRQRDLAVGPDRDFGRHVLVAPVHDRQHVVGTDDVVGRSATAAAARGGAGAAAAAFGRWPRVPRRLRTRARQPAADSATTHGSTMI